MNGYPEGGNVSGFLPGDRVRRSPEHLATSSGLADVGGRVAMNTYGPLVVVHWDDASVSWGIHQANVVREQQMTEPVVTSRQMPGTPYREHTISLNGVELRSQMSSFTPEEIKEAVDLYRQYGICTPKHPCSHWGEQYSAPRQQLPGGATLREPIVYDGLYLED